MSRYVDCYLLSVSKKKLPAYLRMARDAGRLWKKLGALDYKECVGDDLMPKGMNKSVSFSKLAKKKSGETVIFAFAVFKSRADRDRINAEIMTHPSLKKYEKMPMPFDMKRMSFGGFKAEVDPA